MMQTPHVQQQDAIQGSSLLEVRAALQSAQVRDRNVTGYGIRVLREPNTKTIVVFTPKEDESGAIAIRDNTLLPAAELPAILATAKQTDSLHAGNLAPILAAASVVEQRKLGLDGYRVALLRSGTSYVVTFTDKDAQPGGRGSPGKRLGFEVELSTIDLHVIRSNFIR